VETDGGIHRTVFGQQSDNARDRAAQIARWIVLRVSYWALHNEADDIAADLQRALDR
jgi:very-short-patch-repair endonuclease